MYGQTEAIIIVTLFPWITQHSTNLVFFSYRCVIVEISFKCLVFTKICATVCTTLQVGYAIKLRLMRIVTTICTLFITILIVQVPSQTIYNISRSLTNKLHTLPHELRSIFIDKRQRVIILRTFSCHPCSINILDRVSRIEIVHSIQNRSTINTHLYTLMLAIHSIQASRKIQVVFQHFRANHRTEVDTIHIGTSYDTLAIHEIQGSHIGCLLATTIDREVVVMAETCTKNLLLPIGRRTLVISIVQSIGLHITTNIIGRSHIQCFQDIIKCSITRIRYVDTFLIILTFLGGNHNHTIGRLRTIDSCSRGITKHINALYVIRSYHGNIYTRNTINDIIRLHRLTCTERRSTTKSYAWRAIWVARRTNYQSWHFSLQHLSWVCEHTLV